MFADLGHAGHRRRGGIASHQLRPELQYIVHHLEQQVRGLRRPEQVDKVLDAMDKHATGLPDVVKIICADMKGMRGLQARC